MSINHPNFGRIAEDRVFIFDTTLRDGEQSPGMSMNLEEKILVAEALDADPTLYVLRGMYALSKRTDLNAVLTRFNNKNSSQLAPGGNGFLGGVTASAGTDSTNVAFGIRHRF